MDDLISIIRMISMAFIGNFTMMWIRLVWIFVGGSLVPGHCHPQPPPHTHTPTIRTLAFLVHYQLGLDQIVRKKEGPASIVE